MDARTLFILTNINDCAFINKFNAGLLLLFLAGMLLNEWKRNEHKRNSTGPAAHFSPARGDVRDTDV